MNFVSTGLCEKPQGSSLSLKVSGSKKDRKEDRYTFIFTSLEEWKAEGKKGMVYEGRDRGGSRQSCE